MFLLSPSYTILSIECIEVYEAMKKAGIPFKIGKGFFHPADHDFQKSKESMLY